MEMKRKETGVNVHEAHYEISKKLREAKALVMEAYGLVHHTADGATNIDSYWLRGRELNHQIIKNIDLWRGVMDELVHAQGEYFEYTWGELKDIYFPCEECEKTHLQKANK